MDRTPLVKLLLISALSAGLVVPLFFYSRGLLRQAEQALAAAVAAADPADRIVVFGSFYTVGGVLKNGVPRLTAQHLA